MDDSRMDSQINHSTAVTKNPQQKLQHYKKCVQNQIVTMEGVIVELLTSENELTFVLENKFLRNEKSSELGVIYYRVNIVPEHSKKFLSKKLKIGDFVRAKGFSNFGVVTRVGHIGEIFIHEKNCSVKILGKSEIKRTYSSPILGRTVSSIEKNYTVSENIKSLLGCENKKKLTGNSVNNNKRNTDD